MATYLMCGVGGSGVSAIAQVLKARGHRVLGSDRSYDRGLNAHVYDALKAQGIEMRPQDGSGVTSDVDAVVVSSAVEETIPDVKAALEKQVPILKRAEVLAELIHEKRGIAIGGTSGKSTVTGMIGHILAETAREPTVIAGGVMLNAKGGLGNVMMGAGDVTVAETDESDGTIALYRPTVAVLTNISLDHKPMEELRELFGGFCARAREAAVVNADCAESMAVSGSVTKRVTFGLANPADVRADEIVHVSDGVTFRLNGTACRMATPGVHNVANAAAAVAACGVERVPLSDAAEALSTFKGIGRRLQVLGTEAGVTVIDDFGHNPDKIAASLAALGVHPGRLIVFFQPHGFGPTRMLRGGLVDAFAEGLDDEDLLVMPEIFYAGGTAQKDISSNDLVEDVASRGKQAVYCEGREDAGRRIVDEARAGDRVVVMGARDDSLTGFANSILDRLREREPGS